MDIPMQIHNATANTAKAMGTAVYISRCLIFTGTATFTATALMES